MDIKVPGLTEALQKFDKTSAQMDDLNAGIQQIIALLTEQNKMLKRSL